MASHHDSVHMIPRERPASPARRRALLAVSAAAVSACSREAEEQRVSVLTVAAYPQIDEIVRRAAPSWEAQNPGVRVKVLSRPYADHHTAMTTALSTTSGLPDVMALESSFVGRFSHGRGLQDLGLPAFGALGLRDRFVPFAFEQGINLRGEVIALPTDIGPGTLLYRNDLLLRSGVDWPTLSLDWGAFIEAGRRIKRATGAFLLSNAQGLMDAVLRSSLRPGEGLYFNTQSNVLLQSERFERAFELARALRRDGLDARLPAWSNEWAEGFRRGAVAAELSGAWMVGQMANWVAPGTRGQWRVSHLPQGAFVSYGGSFYAMPRQLPESRKPLAWSLMRHLTLEPGLQLRAFQDQDAFPALLETHDSPFFDEPLPFLGGQPARQLWRTASRRITALPVHRQHNFADEVVATELDNVLDRGKPIAAALRDAHRLLELRATR
jgi:multiple sugar transport system substrate-binding protein